ncbi:hypothetical protein F4804DRAFT_329436 [Jackrogersella minutella]|nr:hypothetical protein F4804DRAFT_329436 [Jackrogersella minutella]
MRINTFVDCDDCSGALRVYEVTTLKNTFVVESDGIFLWVSIVLRQVEEGLANGDRMEDLMRLIMSLPKDLERSEYSFTFTFLGFYLLPTSRAHLLRCSNNSWIQSPNALGGVIRLIHRSISEFLESQQFKDKMDLELSDFDPFDAYYKKNIGRVRSNALSNALKFS